MAASGLRWYEKLGFKMDAGLRRYEKLGLKMDAQRRYYFKADMLHKYGTDLTEQAMMRKLDPVIGRQKEIERLTEVLSKRRKRNACLIGDPGVGKTAVVKGLAINIAQGNAPHHLLDKKIFSIDMARLLAGKFEERLNRLLDEVRNSCGSVILFIDEMHTLFADVGAAILKAALMRGDITFICAATAEEYTKHMDKDADAALSRRFVPIQVREPSRDDCIRILKSSCDKYEAHHGVSYHVKALEAAVDLSTYYMPDRFLPDKAIDLIDEAAARASLKHSRICQVSHIEHAVSMATGTPLSASRQRFLQLERTLQRSLIGQDEAVAAVIRAIHRARSGTRDGMKPFGCFLFTGPTGVGKTVMARILAAHYFCSDQALLRLDMSQYTDPHQVSRLIGEFLRRSPHALVLMDEVDKGDRRVLDLLRQVFYDGWLTDGKGNTVDFRHSIIILTSQESTLKPEFLNRCDQVIAFKPLEKEHAEKILRIQLKEFRARVAEKKKIKVTISQKLMERLILEGYSETSGVRMMKKAITKLVEDYLADQILIGNVREGDTIALDYGPGPAPAQGKGIKNLQRPDYKIASDSPRWMMGRDVEVKDAMAPPQTSQVQDCSKS